jgi:hypothetical protein
MTTNEKQEAQTAATDAAKDNGAGIQSSADNLVERASEAREGLKAENDRLEKNLKELRELTARQMLGGGSPAGQPSVEKKETAKEYADRVMSGSK